MGSFLFVLLNMLHDMDIWEQYPLVSYRIGAKDSRGTCQLTILVGGIPTRKAVLQAEKELRETFDFYIPLVTHALHVERTNDHTESFKLTMTSEISIKQYKWSSLYDF
jgi:hypothetical protein